MALQAHDHRQAGHAHTPSNVTVNAALPADVSRNCVWAAGLHVPLSAAQVALNIGLQILCALWGWAHHGNVTHTWKPRGRGARDEGRRRREGGGEGRWGE